VAAASDWRRHTVVGIWAGGLHCTEGRLPDPFLFSGGGTPCPPLHNSGTRWPSTVHRRPPPISTCWSSLRSSPPRSTWRCCR